MIGNYFSKINLLNIMPKATIQTLVFNRNHQSMAIVKEKKRVVGGITFRLFSDNNLAEIVFCVVNSDEQAKVMFNYFELPFKELKKNLIILALLIMFFLNFRDTAHI